MQETVRSHVEPPPCVARVAELWPIGGWPSLSIGFDLLPLDG